MIRVVLSILLAAVPAVLPAAPAAAQVIGSRPAPMRGAPALNLHLPSAFSIDLPGAAGLGLAPGADLPLSTDLSLDLAPIAQAAPAALAATRDTAEPVSEPAAFDGAVDTARAYEGAARMERAADETLLVTGYEAFDGMAENPSADLARHLDGKTVVVRQADPLDAAFSYEVVDAGAEEAGRGRVVSRYRIVGKVLPVDYQRSSSEMKAYLNAEKPALALMFGLGMRSRAIELETVAQNNHIANPEAAPEEMALAPIDPRAEGAFVTNAPVEAVVRQLQAAGIAAVQSMNADCYVCNYAYFKTLEMVRKTAPRTMALFAHLPAASEQILEGQEDKVHHLPLGTMKAAAEELVKALVAQREHAPLPTVAVPNETLLDREERKPVEHYPEPAAYKALHAAFTGTAKGFALAAMFFAGSGAVWLTMDSLFALPIAGFWALAAFARARHWMSIRRYIESATQKPSNVDFSAPGSEALAKLLFAMMLRLGFTKPGPDGRPVPDASRFPTLMVHDASDPSSMDFIRIHANQADPLAPREIISSGSKLGPSSALVVDQASFAGKDGLPMDQEAFAATLTHEIGHLRTGDFLWTNFRDLVLPKLETAAAMMTAAAAAAGTVFALGFDPVWAAAAGSAPLALLAWNTRRHGERSGLSVFDSTFGRPLENFAARALVAAAGIAGVIAAYHYLTLPAGVLLMGLGLPLAVLSGIPAVMRSHLDEYRQDRFGAYYTGRQYMERAILERANAPAGLTHPSATSRIKRLHKEKL